MLIARAPVRVSLMGGGTDLPAYYKRHGGAVVNATIDRYVYVIMNVSERNVLQVTSSDYRTFYRHQPGEPLLWNGDLSLPRAVLQHFGVTHGVSMFLASEVPPGTGLGSSSSVTVALVKAISTACGHTLTPAQVAEVACQVEIEKLSKPVGVQDQYASAFGGFNWMTFDAGGVHVEPLQIAPETVARLEQNLLLVFTGSSQDMAQILAAQGKSSREQDPAVVEALQGVHGLAVEARAILARGELERLGAVLHQAWQHKKKFARGITNERIDRAYQVARNNGALGGKIVGAGGGGFRMLYCDDGSVARVEHALADEGLRRMEYRFEANGARVLFNAGLVLKDSGFAPKDIQGPSSTFPL